VGVVPGWVWSLDGCGPWVGVVPLQNEKGLVRYSTLW
jgi:hypothetical protein